MRSTAIRGSPPAVRGLSRTSFMNCVLSSPERERRSETFFSVRSLPAYMHFTQAT